MNILVTGGAGYIGSFMVKRLLERGDDVVVIDSLERGHRQAIDNRAKFYEGNLLDKEFVAQVFAENKFDAVIHFAAYALAGESMKEPFKYFQNNILGGLNLLEFMKDNGINNIVFSSTCAIYGTPDVLPVTEDSQKHPESVYGESKLMFEKVLEWYDKVYGIKHINLRYFNAAGASLDGTLGEEHDPETHIIPIAIKAALGGVPFFLFGDDYKTQDGTCIRDYIHVEDLAESHILALKKLQEEKSSDCFNLGTGNGHSNLQIIEMVEKVSGTKINMVVKSRREGDPPQIFADNAKAKKELGFNPKYSDLRTIIESAWKWHARVR